MSPVNFSDPATAQLLLDKIMNAARSLGHVRLMEVCGTHTMEIGRLGLRALLPKNIELVSGPGCPVCVTPGGYIDAAADIALSHKAIIVTYGDMVRVPGTRTSLDEAKSRGAVVEVVTSPLQALEIARARPQEQVVFLTVGFETTTPASAKAILNAKHDSLKNLSFFVSHKIVPPALAALVSDTALGISGFLLPGHVSAIIGQKPYQFIAKQGIPGVVTGFEPLDILSGILMMCDMLRHKKAAILNAYTRIARPEGNPRAQKTVYSVFETADTLWRGIGMLPQSGLVMKKEFKKLDASDRFGIAQDGAPDMTETMPKGCSCGEVLKGRIRPNECPLFSKTCTPENPVGPCMVSSEGSCAAYYRYGA
jgi:hydrogenase expression/formation protein HypD